MARKPSMLIVRLKVRWWLKFYLSGVLLTARLTHCEPNWQRVSYWVGKGIKTEVV